MADGHVHCYERYPERPVGCVLGESAPVLDVGDRIEYQGRLFDALPAWHGNFLCVQQDSRGAQVATLRHSEPSADERELAVAGAKGRQA